MRTNLESPRIPKRHPAGRNCRRAAAQLIAVPVGALALLVVFLNRRARRVAQDELVLRLVHRLATDPAIAGTENP